MRSELDERLPAGSAVLELAVSSPGRSVSGGCGETWSSGFHRACLAQSDVFIGLHWPRYGWIGPGMEIWGLEEEVDLVGRGCGDGGRGDRTMVRDRYEPGTRWAGECSPIGNGRIVVHVGSAGKRR